jgi:hypothetical protein
VLIDGHDPDDYAVVLRKLIDNPRWRAELSAGASIMP